MRCSTSSGERGLLQGFVISLLSGQYVAVQRCQRPCEGWVADKLWIAGAACTCSSRARPAHLNHFLVLFMVLRVAADLWWLTLRVYMRWLSRALSPEHTRAHACIGLKARMD